MGGAFVWLYVYVLFVSPQWNILSIMFCTCIGRNYYHAKKDGLNLRKIDYVFS